MNVPDIRTTEPMGAVTPKPPVDRRAQLQADLLKRLLEGQQAQNAELIREQEGKGSLIDIRV